ncbi:uncharacterized protein LOC141685257 [Apium graveolens]|uniref:uncharacterized protein LOC141685257 n=1 Tax=Apium graveolens TaxID=4045 RepID=UPI003D7B1963
MEKSEKKLEWISSVHPLLMALQYPILFPFGEDGYHDEITYVDSETQTKKKRKRITMKEYYSYRLQVRKNEGLHVRLAGRLYQQYVVNAFSCIEQARLWWLRTHQTNLRSDLYSTLAKKVVNGWTDATNVGKGFVLRANFLGSKRYMQQNFQDALAVCRVVGHPDIFPTMTCNSQWTEIKEMMNSLPGCSAHDSPDIIARVMYVVEFQKLGLPHVHMLIWLDGDSKRNLTANVDKYVTAEIPDPITDPVAYDAVRNLMIHGPCGLYCRETYFDQSGFPIYKRRNTGLSVMKGTCVLDNQWVLPYNRDLLVKYNFHMNVEICCHARSLKYLFKYCLKGHDRATVEISSQRRESTNQEESVDEISSYFDGRYICASEAAYRIFSFPIHYRSISVLRLSFHLPGERSCTFTEKDNLEKVVRREQYKQSQLEAFFRLNQNDMYSKQFTYDEIPQYYVWNETDRIWTMRKKGNQIGRLLYTHHNAGELWYLRLLLPNVRGPTSFDALKTVNGVCCRTFKEACKQLGLLDDDNEWHSVLKDCSNGSFP